MTLGSNTALLNIFSVEFAIWARRACITPANAAERPIHIVQKQELAGILKNTHTSIPAILVSWCNGETRMKQPLQPQRLLNKGEPDVIHAAVSSVIVSNQFHKLLFPHLRRHHLHSRHCADQAIPGIFPWSKATTKLVKIAVKRESRISSVNTQLDGHRSSDVRTHKSYCAAQRIKSKLPVAECPPEADKSFGLSSVSRDVGIAPC
jgi:hypothetical protein